MPEEHELGLAALTSDEHDRLVENEMVIERGIKTFAEVGNALLKIRDGRLYRAEFGTFEDYCRERWGFRRQRANELITAALVVDEISSTGTPAPSNEAQAVALARVSEAERAEVWRETVERTGGKPTAAAIRDTWQPPKPTPPPEPNVPQDSPLVDATPAPEANTWYGATTATAAAPEPHPTPEPPQSRPNRPTAPLLTDAEREKHLRLAARQEALNAWNQASDGLTTALSYAKTYTPPADTDIYASVTDFKRRLKELATIAKTWEEKS